MYMYNVWCTQLREGLAHITRVNSEKNLAEEWGGHDCVIISVSLFKFAKYDNHVKPGLCCALLSFVVSVLVAHTKLLR